jgi:hypothetical protein
MDRATALRARDEGAERRAMGSRDKLDGYRMAARIEGGRVKLLPRLGGQVSGDRKVTTASMAIAGRSEKDADPVVVKRPPAVAPAGSLWPAWIRRPSRGGWR